MNFSRPLRSALLALAFTGSSALALDPEAASLLAKAEKGNAIAQYNLGLTYAEGRGVPTDRIEAFIWLSLAIENGARGRALELLTTQLTPNELETARLRYAERRVQLASTVTSASPAPAASTPAAAATEPVAAPASADTDQLRRERDALSAKITDLAGDIAGLRTERERLAKLAAQAQKDNAEARELARAHQEQARIAEMRIAELARLNDQLRAEVTRAPIATPAAPAYPDLRERVADLEAQVTALRDAGPAFPDLRGRVAELERQLASTQPSAPPYPDLRARVKTLEADLAEAAQTVRTAEARVSVAANTRNTELQTARTQLSLSQAETASTRQQLDQARANLRTLEVALAEARQASALRATPAYPDLRARVAELEAQSAALQAAPAAPAHPDLRDRVAELEQRLSIAQDQLAQATTKAAAGAEAEELAAKLAETETRLATALRGYSLLQKDVDERTASAALSSDALSRERDDLAARLASTEETARAAQAEVARLTESLAALQRSTGESFAELSATRALLRETQGANNTLARENYDLKTALARDPSRGQPTAPATQPSATDSRTHTVAAGDTLSRISLRYYGSTGRWQDIFAANRDVLDEKGTLRIGMTLRLP